MCGLLTNIKKIYTKSNRQMAFSEFEDMYGSIETVFFPAIYDKYSRIIEENKVMEVRGKINLKENEKPKILIETIKEMTNESKLFIKIEEAEEEEKQEIIKEVMNLIKGYTGDTKVYIYFEDSNDLKLLSNEWNVDSKNEELNNKLIEAFGKENIKYV